jgi:hypothetical protein
VFGIQGSFEEAIQINEITRELNLPFYALNSSGLNAFFYSDLALENFEFQVTKKDAEGVETSSINSIKGSLTLKSYLAKFVDKSQAALTWKKRDILKPSKLLLLSII